MTACHNCVIIGLVDLHKSDILVRIVSEQRAIAVYRNVETLSLVSLAVQLGCVAALCGLLLQVSWRSVAWSVCQSRP